MLLAILIFRMGFAPIKNDAQKTEWRDPSKKKKKKPVENRHLFMTS